MNKNTYTAIDIAKYISALLVVCIHTFPLYDLSPVANMAWIQCVCRIAVPFFFTVSAFLFFRKIDPKKGRKDEVNTAELKHYLRRLLYLYLTWTILYLPYTFLLWRSEGYTITFLMRWVFDCFFNGSYYHLWFLPALMLGTLIVYTLYTSVRLKKGLCIVFILYVIGMLMNVYGEMLAAIPYVSILYNGYMRIFTTGRNGIFFAPVFLYIGIYLKEFKGWFNKKEFLIGIGCCYGGLLVEEGLAYFSGMMQDLTCMYLMLVPLLYFMVGALLQVRRAPSYLTRFLRQSSLLIYVSHILFAMPLLNIFPTQHLLVYGVTILASQVLAVVFIALSNRFACFKIMC